jgi:hypothetical protein
VYADAGCICNRRGLRRFGEYISAIDETRYGVLSLQLSHRESTWTTRQLFGHLCPPRSAGLAARQRPPKTPSVWMPPHLAHSSACTETSCSSTTAPSSRQCHNPLSRPTQAAALLPTLAHTLSLTQAPRTTATASSSYRNSSAFIWHSSGVRCPSRRLPALRTSRPSSPRSPPSLPSAVSRSSSPRIGRPSRPCVSTTPARGSRSSASFTSPRNTRPLSRTPLLEWR